MNKKEIEKLKKKEKKDFKVKYIFINIILCKSIESYRLYTSYIAKLFTLSITINREKHRGNYFDALHSRTILSLTSIVSLVES